MIEFTAFGAIWQGDEKSQEKEDITGMVGGKFAFVKNGKTLKIFTIGQLKTDMKKT